MWKSILVTFVWVLMMSGNAQAVCGDVTGEGNVTSSDALAVLREAVGQQTDLMCDCGPGGTCNLGGNNDGCEGVDEFGPCSACCAESSDCATDCALAVVANCDNDGLNTECAQEINDAGCGGVCCPGE